MPSYRASKSSSRAILAGSIAHLIKHSSHLGLSSQDIREVLYALSEQDWWDEPASDGQLSLFLNSFGKEVKK
jgi:hypothetical protein